MVYVKKYSDSDLLSLLKIRLFEKSLLELFAKGFVNGTTHTCIGQEYIPVALKALIQTDDFILSNHRSHGHFLAQFSMYEELLSELTGRTGALCKGYGGSQHLYIQSKFLSTGIIGENFSVACGVALAFKKQKESNLAISYIGDGALGEGAIYESLNFAGIHRLPCLLVIENNQIAQTTKPKQNLAGSIDARMRAFDFKYLKITTTDITEIRNILEKPVQDCRNGTPTAVEFVTHRNAPHSKGDDTRSVEELESIRQTEWAHTYSAQFPEQFNESLNQASDFIKSLTDKVLSKDYIENDHG